MLRTGLFLCFFALLSFSLAAQTERAMLSDKYTKADTLRGSNTPERTWWDVKFYDLKVKIVPENKYLSGQNEITYSVTDERLREKANHTMQIDLMPPLEIDSIKQEEALLSFHRADSFYFVKIPKKEKTLPQQKITVYYHGQPHEAVHPPWQGGFVWEKDSLDNPWIATAVQGFGASAWWPNKDYQGDEPDSQRIQITVPDTLVAVSNGKLRATTSSSHGEWTFTWMVSNPINNYNVALNIGKYVHLEGLYEGEKRTLPLHYYVLPYHVQAAERQFRQVKDMLSCFEEWFGPYPWYEDSYKLVEAPFLGMEHQSNIAYGNHFENGYRGTDLSGTGWGQKWDFIIVHESAHEWWGNNITTGDRADMWVHEAFANYAEALYTEHLFGREAGDAYCQGVRKLILNDKPIIPPYGVNAMGSGDMYYKGGNMILILREIINDDALFKKILRGLNHTFRHQIVTGEQIQDYINKTSGMDFSKVFKQYLETTQIPTLRCYYTKGKLHYKWANVVKDFDMPVKVSFTKKTNESLIYPSEQWKTKAISKKEWKNFSVSKNFYVEVKKGR